MRNTTQGSIRQRLMAIVMGTSAAATVFGSIFYLAVALVLQWNDMERDSASLARVIGGNCEAALAFQIPGDAEGIISTLANIPTVSEAVLYSVDGKQFASYARDGRKSSGPPPGSWATRYANGSLWAAHRITKANRHLGTLYLCDDLGSIRVSLRRNLVVVGLVTGLAMLMAYLVARRLVSRITGPIRRLTDTAKAVSGRLDYGVRANIEGPDEIGVLIRTFNEMLEGIQTREAALKKANAEIEAAHDALEDKVEKRTAELARSNRDLEQFAYVASHDLQEPLRKIKSFAQLFAMHHAGKMDAEGAKYVAYVVDGAERMQALIQDLLTYSRVSRVDMERENVDFNVLLQEAISNIETLIRESNAKVTSDRLPALPANARMMVMVFQNLVGNAVKFRRDVPPEVHVGARREKGEWILYVRDNGIGIDRCQFGKLFQVFQRLHGRAEFPGNGIGLALCKKVVERHGGRMWVESETGKGSDFFFAIPDVAHGVRGVDDPGGLT